MLQLKPRHILWLTDKQDVIHMHIDKNLLFKVTVPHHRVCVCAWEGFGSGTLTNLGEAQVASKSRIA